MHADPFYFLFDADVQTLSGKQMRWMDGMDRALLTIPISSQTAV